MPMLDLDRTLAQSIVDRTMQIIDVNVNVMDAQGVIIASGDAARIGQVHRGALQVLREGIAMEVTEELAATFPGVMPGVNLPLRLGDKVIGCIGLSGAPDSIRRYGQLVHMAAETMLEQADLMQLLARDARIREELTLSLIREGRVPGFIADEAARIGIDPATPRVAVILGLDHDTAGGRPDVAVMQDQYDRLMKMGRHVLAAPVTSQEIVLLRPALDARGKWQPQAQLRWIEDLQRQLHEASGVRFRAALGGYVPESEGGVRLSCHMASGALRVGRLRRPTEAIHNYADLRLHVLMDEVALGWQAAELGKRVEKLRQSDKTGRLEETLRVWFQHDMKIASAAAALGVHRNSLDYRLGRVQDICGCDLSRVDDLFELYFALLVGGSARAA